MVVNVQEQQVAFRALTEPQAAEEPFLTFHNQERKSQESPPPHVAHHAHWEAPWDHLTESRGTSDLDQLASGQNLFRLERFEHSMDVPPITQSCGSQCPFTQVHE